jgi:hypothetical protein
VSVGDEDFVDPRQQLLVEQAGVFTEGLVVEVAAAQLDGSDTHEVAHESVVVGDVFEAVVVAVQAQADDPEHEQVPQIHAGAAGGFLVAHDMLLQQGEDLLVDLGRREDPLEAREDGREFIAALEGNEDLFDGRLAQLQLGFESLAHGCEA